MLTGWCCLRARFLKCKQLLAAKWKWSIIPYLLIWQTVKRLVTNLATMLIHEESSPNYKIHQSESNYSSGRVFSFTFFYQTAAALLTDLPSCRWTWHFAYFHVNSCNFFDCYEAWLVNRWVNLIDPSPQPHFAVFSLLHRFSCSSRMTQWSSHGKCPGAPDLQPAADSIQT